MNKRKPGPLTLPGGIPSSNTKSRPPPLMTTPTNKPLGHNNMNAPSHNIPVDLPESSLKSTHTQLLGATVDDFEKLAEIGVGNGGVVTKVRHRKSGDIFAQKLIHLEVKKEIRIRIFMELALLKDCKHENIVGYYGSFHVPAHNEIIICMEHMDGRSLDVLLQHAGRLPQRVIGHISVTVLKGLRYLHEHMRVMHRDIKPSNILVNSKGEVKLCDFGVSAQLINSIANSFVGTRSYMAPERLMGSHDYTIKSDVWALGISLIEIAIGFYPIPRFNARELEAFIESHPVVDAMTDETFSESFRRMSLNGSVATGTKPTSRMSIFELLEYIVSQPPPQLYAIEGAFTEDFVSMVNSCLRTTMTDRPTFEDLMNMKFVTNSEVTQAQDKVYFSGWVSRIVKQCYSDHRDR